MKGSMPIGNITAGYTNLAVCLGVMRIHPALKH